MLRTWILVKPASIHRFAIVLIDVTRSRPRTIAQTMQVRPRTKVRFRLVSSQVMLIQAQHSKACRDDDQEKELAESKPAVILVEDDPSVLRALRRLMNSFGYEVWAFSRPSELQAVAIPDSNACLVLDVHLPEMSGVELYEALAASGCRLPVILITAHADDGTLLMASRISTAAVLIKPFSRDLLLNALTKALARFESSP
jgi:CheY-like chemotaxis protein